jgi:hypothetical protein
LESQIKEGGKLNLYLRKSIMSRKTMAHVFCIAWGGAGRETLGFHVYIPINFLAYSVVKNLRQFSRK